MSESFTLDTEKVDPPKVDAPSPSPSFNEISTPRLIIFVMLMAISQIFTQAALAQTVVPFKYVSKSFDVESSGELSWFTASYSLTVGTFILIAGQLGDLFGYKKLYLIGYTIFGLFSLICGFATFSHSAIFFDIMRALQGLGLAIAVPNSLGLIGGYFPHGSHSKNIALSLFGGVAPMGFLIGAVFSSLIAQFSWWPWYFWITGIASCIVLILGYIFIPKGIRGQDDKGSWKDFDYFGSLFGVTGLVLFNFAWNQGPVVGWETPYVYILLIIGILAIVGFFYVELKVSKRPLVPREVLTGDTGFVLACIISGWSCFGIWIYYQFQFSEFILHQSPLLSTAQMVPTMFAGLIAGISTTYMLKYFSTSVVMTISLCCFLIGSCLMGTRPVTQIYWAQKFPSAILTPFGMDISFPAATIVLSHHLKKEHQGVAASVVATCVNYSISIGLGIAGTVQRYVDPQDLKTLEGMRAAFYTGIGLAVLGVVVGLAFIIKQRALTV